MTSSWSAPGRVNLIGEHVDYNDGLVLPFALPFTTSARVTARSDDHVVASSRGMAEVVRFPAQTEPGEVRGWASYVAGVVWAMRQHGCQLPGVDVEVTSDVPIGAGLSSSAAMQCAVAAAINDELDLGLTRMELVAVTNRSENDYVGLPNGVMDQVASMFGEHGHALLLDCRSLEIEQLRLDLTGNGMSLLVIDTHAKHALVGTEYADRRASCEEAAAALGLASLRDATTDDVLGLGDVVTRMRAHHVVSEIQRVRDVVAVLRAGRPQDMGAFLTASHESLRDDYTVSCDELDVTVEAALSAGALGARMTGGGFGGSAIALARDEDAATVLERVDAAYHRRGWQPPTTWAAAPSVGARRLG